MEATDQIRRKRKEFFSHRNGMYKGYYLIYGYKFTKYYLNLQDNRLFHEKTNTHYFYNTCRMLFVHR